MPTSNNLDISDERLGELDTVLDLVRNLSSSDEQTVQNAVKHADEYLEKKKPSITRAFDRTVINKSNPSSSMNGMNSHGTAAAPGPEAQTFMNAVRKDAEERAERRANQRAHAEKLKERANVFFKSGDWRRAIDLYSQAISQTKDWEILYTNRAQAYLRSGDPASALGDCDRALEIFSFHLSIDVANYPDPDSPSTPQPHAQVAKAHYHRAKALMALNQPVEALQAYKLSGLFSVQQPTHNSASPNPSIPAHLKEYVVQAETAVAAREADCLAESEFANRAIQSELDETQIENRLVCLLAQLARGNQDLTYYSAGLRQLIRLFASAPHHPTVTANDAPLVATSQPSPVNHPPKTLTDPTNRNAYKKNRKKSSRQNRSVAAKVNDVRKQAPVVVEQTVKTFADLQTLFRVKKGFALLGREIEVISLTFNPNSPTISQNDDYAKPSSTVDSTDRLQAVLDLTKLITLGCGENQRLLIEQHHDLVNLTLKCMALSPDFVQSVSNQLSDLSVLMNDGETVHTSAFEVRKQHKLEMLRAASCDLMITLTSMPSGRQSLLNQVGPNRLLDALAVCLTEMFGQQSVASSGFGSMNRLTQANRKLSSPVSALCAAKAAQILENLTESSSFLMSIRSSADSLDSLLSVIEAALSVRPAVNQSQLTTTTSCLSILLDALSAGCADVKLRKEILQKRQPLITALADSLQRHAPLFGDKGHAQLVGSICRLLHNMFVGQLGSTMVSSSLASYMTSSNVLADKLLSAVGAVLDQPGHGPELRAVATALAGRLLPACPSSRILAWFGEPTLVSGDTNNHPQELTERSRLLLSIIDSCSLPPTNRDKKANSTADANSFESDRLSAHLVGGCVRCLAAGTAQSLSMRYAIGDDRRRVRRLARLVRARCWPPTPHEANDSLTAVKRNVCPRDEVLAGNVCLILQYCSDDTPLAEHLQGTSVILDLLQLIQESQQLDTKRNAAIVIGKMAQASHIHRDELSRLDGWSVLKPFNSWNAALGLF